MRTAKFLIAAMAALAFVAAPTVPAFAQMEDVAEEAPEITSFDDAAEALLEILGDLNGILADVEDQASAETGASKINELATYCEENIVPQIQALGEPTEEQEATLETTYGGELESQMEAMMGHFMRLSQNESVMAILEPAMTSFGEVLSQIE